MKLIRALSPILSFILFYFTLAIGLKDFYAVPILPLLIISFILTLISNRQFSFEQKLKAFSKSAGNELIITMLMIFLLAGIFSELGTATGALKTLTSWVQYYIPTNLFIAGIFIFSCLLSITIGTSVGTIIALAPLASQIEYQVPNESLFLLGSIVGGAMFGDNLSFISDTTVAVTRTHGIAMKDKFKANILLVLPAAIICIVIYTLYPIQSAPSITDRIPFDWQTCLTVAPYFLVLVLVFLNINLMYILSIGIFGFILVGALIQDLPITTLLNSCNTGALSLTELCIITLFLAGLSGIIQLYGGFEMLLRRIKGKKKSIIKSSLNIAGLSAITNLFLANNTLAIIIVGPLAKDIATESGIPMRRSASIVDTMTCCVQGLIPYGAQLLLAVSLSGLTISSFSLLPYLIYPILIGISTLVWVFIPIAKEKKG